MTQPIGPLTIRPYEDATGHHVLDAEGRILVSCGRWRNPRLSQEDVLRLTREDAEKAMAALTAGQPVPGWRKAWPNGGGGYTLCDADDVVIGCTSRHVRDRVEVLTEAEAAALGDLLTGGRCNSTSWRWERESA